MLLQIYLNNLFQENVTWWNNLKISLHIADPERLKKNNCNYNFGSQTHTHKNKWENLHNVEYNQSFHYPGTNCCTHTHTYSLFCTFVTVSWSYKRDLYFFSTAITTPFLADRKEKIHSIASHVHYVLDAHYVFYKAN